MTATKIAQPEHERSGHDLRAASTHVLVYSRMAAEMLRKQLFHEVGEDLARAILAQAGRHGGFHDARALLQERSITGVEEMVFAKFQALAASGFGAFEVLTLAIDAPAKEAYVRARCRGSPEAESHRRLFGAATMPACYHLVGYSTGWASAMTGMQLLTVETLCAAKGDDYCELETLPYDDFVGPEAAFWKRTFESTSKSLAQELTEKLATIQRQMATISEQQSAIAKLSTPILQVADGVLVLPVIGAVDSERARSMMEKLLPEIVRRAARGIIIDVTGVEALDTGTADHLLRMARAATLLGARVIVTGIAPAVAQVLVAESVDLPNIRAFRTLQDGIRHLDRAY